MLSLFVNSSQFGNLQNCTHRPEDTAHQMPVLLSGMFIQTKPDNFFHHLATGGVIPGSMCCQVSAIGYEYFQRSFIP